MPSGEVTTAGGLAEASVPLFRSLDAAVKHPLGPALAALKVWETLMRSHSTTPGSAAKRPPRQREDLPASHMGAPGNQLDHWPGSR